jgi:hypothetical protein
VKGGEERSEENKRNEIKRKREKRSEEEKKRGERRGEERVYNIGGSSRCPFTLTRRRQLPLSIHLFSLSRLLRALKHPSFSHPSSAK